MFLFLLFSLGCRYHLTINTIPLGGDVVMNSKNLGPAPIDTILWGLPFKKAYFSVKKEGYRTVLSPTRLKHRTLRQWRLPQNELSYILIKAHGPVGTWTPEDAHQP